MCSVFLFKRLLASVFVASLLTLAGCVASKEEPQLIQSQAWLMDNTGTATLQDVVLRGDWQPMRGWQGWGYGSEPIWIRTTLKAAEPDARLPWIVRVRPAYLDYLTLYDPSTGRVMRSGDAFPPSDDSLGSINFTFQIPALPKEREIYLRLNGTSNRILNLEVLPYWQAQLSNRMQEWLAGFFNVTSGIFALWASVQWWSSTYHITNRLRIADPVKCVEPDDLAAVIRPAHVVASDLTPTAFKLQGHPGVRGEKLRRS